MQNINGKNSEGATEKVPRVCSEKYKKLLYEIYSRKKLTRILKTVGYALCFGVVCLFAFGSVLIFKKSASELLRFYVICGVPFVAVSIFRRLINSKRPYEIFDFYDMPNRKREGCSFPSRHVFSAFIIGVALLSHSIPLGVMSMVMGAFIAAIRVLLGVHFVRDVLAGALIGAMAGAIGIFIGILI